MNSIGQSTFTRDSSRFASSTSVSLLPVSCSSFTFVSLKTTCRRIDGEDDETSLGSALRPNLLKELDDGARIGQSVRVVVLSRFDDPLHGTTKGLVSVVDET